jgi:cupin 2 domain-containing protein
MMENLHDGIPSSLPAELVTILAESKAVRIERIVSKGHASPEEFWYDQERTEFVLLIQGEAKLEFAGKEEVTSMRPGDYVVIPPHVRHKVLWTPPGVETIWLALHYDSLSPTDS